MQIFDGKIWKLLFIIFWYDKKYIPSTYIKDFNSQEFFFGKFKVVPTLHKGMHGVERCIPSRLKLFKSQASSLIGLWFSHTVVLRMLVNS